jgi:hypothetical protein
MDRFWNDWLKTTWKPQLDSHRRIIMNAIRYGIMAMGLSVGMILAGYAIAGDGMHDLSAEQVAHLRGGCPEWCWEDSSCYSEPERGCSEYNSNQPACQGTDVTMQQEEGYACVQSEEGDWCDIDRAAGICAVTDTCWYNAITDLCQGVGDPGAYTEVYAVLSCEDAEGEYN